MMLGMNSALYMCGNMPVLCLYISIDYNTNICLSGKYLEFCICKVKVACGI